jgi:hypothetical protein
LRQELQSNPLLVLLMQGQDRPAIQSARRQRSTAKVAS